VQINATIQVNGRPLRRAYVEHLVLGVGTGMYMTDLDGRIRSNDFDLGVESLTGNADIRVICQNPIVRVLDGNLLNIGVYQDAGIVDGDVVNLNTNAEQDDHYAILNRVQLAYEVAFLPLTFFRSQPSPEFPLGRLATLRATRDQARRIDLSYPDNFPSALAFVEPKRALDNFPLMHLKDRGSDGRLFGEAGQAPTLIPHELAHALHFSFLTEAKRGTAQDKYLQFLATDVLAGGGGTHNFTMRTSPEVAYIEAGGFYSQLFWEFMRARQGGTSTLVTPEPITAAMQAEFVASEWQRLTVPRIPLLPALVFPGLTPGSGTGLARLKLSSRVERFLRRPTVTGGDVEGAVYSAIFVDFARFVGLDFAASAYFRANALTFGQYREFIRNQHPEHADTLEQVRGFWGL